MDHMGSLKGVGSATGSASVDELHLLDYGTRRTNNIVLGIWRDLAGTNGNRRNLTEASITTSTPQLPEYTCLVVSYTETIRGGLEGGDTCLLRIFKLLDVE
jgi:hypothetical protein